MRLRLTGLWRNQDFVRLWAAATVSTFGSLVTRVALPFMAVLVLDATPMQIAVLTACDFAPGVLIGLVAGVWVDRLRRRPILIAADIGRALLLASIPAAAVLDALRIEQLYVVALLAGVLTVFFEVAHLAYLPSLVGRDDLVEGNSKISAAGSVAEVGAFGIAGWLVQLLTAPFAILIDAVSFLVSALFIGLIRAPDPTPAPAAERQSVRREIVEGLRLVLGNAVLRATAASNVTMDFCSRMYGTLYSFYALEVLGFEPGVLSMIYAVGGVSSFVGAFAAGWAARRVGVGPAMVYALLLVATGMVFTPLATGATVLGALLLIAAQLVTDPAWVVYEVNQVSLRQAITPDRLLGRLNATFRFSGLGAMLLGTFAAGVLGETVGARAVLVAGACGMVLAAAWLVFSPARTLKAVPVGAGAGSNE